ncbi:ATP-binding protein [Pokkaliibacter sp. CJK22405]|uniref:sensor histidine kinase n=1 Tax=Pokkaliibacter sp. CJK22405 TaxID=3384615 RepID=UPI003984A4E5
MLTGEMLPLVFELMMLLTSGCGLLVAGWLVWRSRGQRELVALAGFGLMMALWCAGHVAIFLDWRTLGVALVLANPLMPTCFLDFALRYVNQGSGRRPWLDRLSASMGGIYLVSLLVVISSWWLGAGTTRSVAGFHRFFVFTPAGSFNLAYTVLIGILAHAILLLGFRWHQGNRRRSIFAMFITGGWGLLLATSFVFPSLGLEIYPYPLLLLPSYVVLLTYSVVRYQLLEVNAWANRALLWLCMNLVVLGMIALAGALAGQLGMEALALLPWWQLWLYSLLVLAVAAALRPALSAVAERLVYPGIKLSSERLEHWLTALKSAADWGDLARIASGLLTPVLGQTIEVCIEGVPQQIQHPPGDGRVRPRLVCRQVQGQWECEQQNWHDQSPTIRMAGEVFSSLLVSSCALMEQSLRRAEAERQRLSEQHLVELGGLSAAMAHELRNPLNIIAMAATGVDAESRDYIQQQLQRADRLISDMLSYSGQLRLQPQMTEMGNLIEAVVAQTHWHQVRVSLSIAPGASVYADPYRVQQILVNLIENALAFIRNQTDGRMLIEANDAGVLRVHNNGPALPESLKTTLFRPFVSKRPGGSGLGLAIIRRIVDAHGGEVLLREDLGWPVSFEVHLPADADAWSVAHDSGEPAL